MSIGGVGTGPLRPLTSTGRDPKPGGPEIRLHRLPRRRTSLYLATAAATATLVAVAFGAPPAVAQDAPTTSAPPGLTASTAPPTTTTTSTTVPTPEPATAKAGTYSAPRWLPLRRYRPGNEITVGCTLESYGSQFGYECSGHHSRWAIDFLADTGTPVYAAGAGLATNLTGKSGGSGFGNVVSIDHGFGITSLYAHFASAFVPAEGMWVDETTLLGTVGQTGSASAPHLHYEVFGNPGGSNSRNPVSIDPGPLFACRGALLVAFPQVAGLNSWAGLPWGALTVASDGHDCTLPEPPAKPAIPVPSSTTTTTTTSTEPADAADAGGAWSTIIAPVIDLVGGTAQRLDLDG